MAGLLDIVLEKIASLQEAIDNWLNKLPASMEPYIDILKSPIELPFVINAPFKIRVLTAFILVMLITFIIIMFIATIGLFHPSKTTLSKWENKKATKTYDKMMKKQEAKAFKLYKKEKKKNPLDTEDKNRENIEEKANNNTTNNKEDIMLSEDNVYIENNKKKNTDTNIMGLFGKKDVKVNTAPNVVAPKTQRRGRESDDESIIYTPEKATETEKKFESSTTANYNMQNFSPLEFKKAKKEQEKRAKKERKEQLKREKYEAKRNKNKPVVKPKVAEKRIDPIRPSVEPRPIIAPIVKEKEIITPDVIEEIKVEKKATIVTPQIVKENPAESLEPIGNRSKRKSFDYLDELLKNEPSVNNNKDAIKPTIEKTNTISNDDDYDDDDDDDDDDGYSLQIEDRVLITNNPIEEPSISKEPETVEKIVIIEPIKTTPEQVKEPVIEIITPAQPVKETPVKIVEEVKAKAPINIVEDDLSDFFSKPKKEAEVKVVTPIYPHSSTTLGADELDYDEDDIIEAEEAQESQGSQESIKAEEEKAEETIEPEDMPKIITPSYAKMTPKSLLDDEIGDIDEILEELKANKDSNDKEPAEPVAEEIVEATDNEQVNDIANLIDVVEQVEEIKEESATVEVEEDIYSEEVIEEDINSEEADDNKDNIYDEEITEDDTDEDTEDDTEEYVQDMMNNARKIPSNLTKTKIKVQEANDVSNTINKANLVLQHDQFEILESDDKFFFVLMSENNELVFTSITYKTLPSCMSGVQTFKKNVRTGEFIIEKDKFGSCKFVLTNKSSKLVKYYGELFRTEEECINNIEEVKRLAQIVPIFEIVQGDNGFTFSLISDNGDTIFLSRDYKTMSSCMSGTLTFKKNVSDGIFEICKDEETNQFIFILSSKSNSLVKYYGIPFTTTEECMNNIEEVKEFSSVAQIKVKNY